MISLVLTRLKIKDMKVLTDKQKKLANQAVNALSRLQDEGVVAMIIDPGGGLTGLTFWNPTPEEDDNAEELIHSYEFLYEFSYVPRKSLGLRIDVIVP